MSRRFSSEEATELLMQDDSAGNCDDESESSNNKLNVGDSASEYITSSSEELILKKVLQLYQRQIRRITMKTLTNLQNAQEQEVDLQLEE